VHFIERVGPTAEDPAANLVGAKGLLPLFHTPLRELGAGEVGDEWAERRHDVQFLGSET
jgi:hypothetical protein